MSINRKKQKRARLRNKKRQEQRRVIGTALRAERILGGIPGRKERWDWKAYGGIARVGDTVQVDIPSGVAVNMGQVTITPMNSSDMVGVLIEGPGGGGGSGLGRVLVAPPGSLGQMLVKA